MKECFGFQIITVRMLGVLDDQILEGMGIYNESVRRVILQVLA